MLSNELQSAWEDFYRWREEKRRAYQKRLRRQWYLLGGAMLIGLLSLIALELM